MRDIVLNMTNNEELEALLPIDRSITIDANNTVYLYDTMFIINENDIKEVLNDK